MSAALVIVYACLVAVEEARHAADDDIAR